jgi:hypothetical protein
MAAHKTSFLPDKPIIHPFSGEGVVSYGDRLLWHQLGYVHVVTGYGVRESRAKGQ